MALKSAKAMRKPRADSVRNRERLLAAAAEVFRTGGAEASLEAVARCAGVGIGTLYRHFPTRDALFEAVYRREVEQLAALADELAKAADPVAALREWLRASIRLVATKRGALTALALAVDSSSDVYAYSQANLTRAAGMLLKRAIAAEAIRADVTAEDILHVVIGMSLMGKDPGWEENVIRLIDIFVDGLKT
ncbi:TetR/AcrR family transcriptional regulator [Aurantimonas sp. HBX-1]|uniref:TetR/AcrR family transcriptional regulator n=1 Tax=Aurantimonas sp. HBX-1 TaxID=2906072 RepID=UPI001F33821D|nr:TetR/AcrR family transcriptional regulator [Aurantimonas sp. HBX-1]UIJ72550.1 TetR/AcrR family transcriptional regulator [Aurantimonas sp. HBX-1]